MERIGCWSGTWMLTMGITISKAFTRSILAPQSFTSLPILQILVQSACIPCVLRTRPLRGAKGREMACLAVLWIPACAGMTVLEHNTPSFPSFTILSILVQNAPRVSTRGVFPFLVSRCPLRGDAAAEVDPDALADFDVVIVLEDHEFAADCIPGVGTLVAA